MTGSVLKEIIVQFSVCVCERLNRLELKGTNEAKFAVFFAAFRLSWHLQHLGGADFCRKPQETVAFRRLQHFAETWLSH